MSDQQALRQLQRQAVKLGCLIEAPSGLVMAYRLHAPKRPDGRPGDMLGSYDLAGIAAGLKRFKEHGSFSLPGGKRVARPTFGGVK